jgi:hypothetical protein
MAGGWLSCPMISGIYYLTAGIKWYSGRLSCPLISGIYYLVAGKWQGAG